MNSIMRGKRAIIKALTWFVITSQVFTQSVWADSLATPKITHPDANKNHALSELIRFEICYGASLLQQNHPIPSINYVLEGRYKVRKKAYEAETDELIKAELSLGPVEFTSYDRNFGAALFRFRNNTGEIYRVLLSAEQKDYQIEKIKAAAVLTPQDERVILEFRQQIKDLTDQNIGTIWASDMDDTLMPAGSRPSQETIMNILRVIDREPFLLITGLNIDRMNHQLLTQLEEAAKALGHEKNLVNFVAGANNGSEIYTYDMNEHRFARHTYLNLKAYLKENYEKVLGAVNQCVESEDIGAMIRDVMGWSGPKGSFIKETDSQITFMVLGEDATTKEKAHFNKEEEDKDSKYYHIRERVYVPFLKEAFHRLGIEIEARKSGLSSIDITPITKGTAITMMRQVLADKNLIRRGEQVKVIFSGDAFNEGENDEPAVSVADIIINVGAEPGKPITKLHYTLKEHGPDGFNKLLSAYAEQKFASKPRDIKGAGAPDSNAVIKGLIKHERVVEVYLEGDVLKANKVEYQEKYVPSKTPSELYRGEEVKIGELFSESEITNLKKWIVEHPTTGPPVKFRIVLDEPALGWRNSIENSNIAHASYRDQSIYFGHFFLKYLMADGKDREEMRADVLNDDELQHLLHPENIEKAHQTEAYADRLARVSKIIVLLNNVSRVRKNLGYLRDISFRPLHEEAERMFDNTTLITEEAVASLSDRYASYLKGGDAQRKLRESLRLKDGEVISYNSLEYAVTPQLPFFAGGLGALAGDHVGAAGDLLPDGTFVGFGGYYKFGYVTQLLDETGWQKDARDVNKRVSIERFGEIVKDTDGNDIIVDLPMPGGKTIYLKSWKVQVGRAPLYLFTTDISENDQNPSYRKYLDYTYDSNDHIRLVQEYIVGVGGERLLERLGFVSGGLHLNEGHVGFAILEKARRLLSRKIDILNEKFGLAYRIETLANVPIDVRRRYGLTLLQALEAVRGSVAFTSHTPVLAGNQLFPTGIAKEYLEAYLNTFGGSFNEIAFGPMLHAYPANPAFEVFDMTEFVITFCQRFNAVARKHADVCRAMYKDTNKQIEESGLTRGHKRPEVFNVTNAVCRAYYQPEEMAALLEKKLDELKKLKDNPMGPGVTLDEISWEDAVRLVSAVSDEEMAAVSRLMLENGLKELRQLAANGHRLLPYLTGEQIEIDPDAFIVAFGRRMAGYKRADFILDPLDKNDMIVWRAIVEEAQRLGKKVQLVYMGKAHDTDTGGKSIIQKILHVARTDGDYGSERPVLKRTIIFIENYDTDVARAMVKIATAALNNPEPPKEASGTSGMKYLLAGKPSMSVMDGWTLEAKRGIFPFVTRRELKDIMSGPWRYMNYAGRAIQGGRGEGIGRVPTQEPEYADGKIVYECMDPQCRNVWSAKVDEQAGAPDHCPKCGSLAIKNNSYHELGLMDIYFNHKDRWYQIMRESLVQGLAYFTSHRMFKEYADKVYVPIVEAGRIAEDKYMRLGIENNENIMAPLGTIRNGLETLISMSEFFTTGVMFREFKLYRLMKDNMHRTTSRDELKELEKLGIVEVDRSGKAYRYMLRSDIRNLSPPERITILNKILTIKGLDKRTITDREEIAHIKSEINFILRKFPNPKDLTPENRAVILISGGESPGVNNYFALLARKLAREGKSLELVRFGLVGLVKARVEFDQNRVWVDWNKAELIMNMPGAAEGTARTNLNDETMKVAIDNLAPYCRTLYIVGGNDHLGEAKKLAERFRKENVDMAVIALPKTIDHDTIDYPIGAETAAENAQELVRRAIPAPGSNKCVVIQEMGRDMGYLTARAAEVDSPLVVVGLPEWSHEKQSKKVTVYFADIVDAVRARMNKYRAAVVVISEGFKMSKVVKEGPGRYTCKDDPVLEKVLHNRLLAAKLDNLGTDAKGNPKLTALGIADFITEALTLEEGLGLVRDNNLFLEDPGYSGRATEPNAFDRAVAELVTDIAVSMVSTAEGREKILEIGGVCIAADRTARTIEDIERTVRAKPLADAVGVIDLTTGTDHDSGLILNDRLLHLNILGFPGYSNKNLPDLKPPQMSPKPEGYNREVAIRSINSQLESARDMDAGRPNICVLARADADEIISSLKDRAPISEADKYVIERTKNVTRWITSREYISLQNIIDAASANYKDHHKFNVIISGDFPVKQNDEILMRMIEDKDMNELVKALIAGARQDGGNLIFGRRLADLLVLALSQKGIGDIRKNILGEVLNLLPNEDGEIVAPRQSATGVTLPVNTEIVAEAIDLEGLKTEIEVSSAAGEYARRAAEALFPGEMHLIFVKKAIPEIQQKTTLAVNVASLCEQYYEDKLEGYTVDIVDDHKAATALLAKNPDWTRNNTIIGLVDREDLDKLAEELKADNMTDKAKVLSMEKASDDQLVPIKPFFDLMAAIVRINRPLNQAGDKDLIDYIAGLLAKIGAKDADNLIGLLSSSDFQDPIKFAREFIIRLLPPARRFDTRTLKELYQASRKVVESL